MKNRKPLEIKPILIIYNFLMILLNFVIFFKMAKEIFILFNYSGFNLFCLPYELHHPIYKEMQFCVWLFYISKPIEFLDTLAFILRKKENHVSFLHVFHHLTTFLIVWIGMRYYPDLAICEYIVTTKINSIYFDIIFL